MAETTPPAGSRPWRRLAIGVGVTTAAVLVAWNARLGDRSPRTPESRAQPEDGPVAVVLEAPVRSGSKREPTAGVPEGPPSASPPSVPAPPDPADPASRSLPFRLEVVDATDGRDVSAAWALRLERGAAWIVVTDAEPTVSFREEKGLLGFLGIVPRLDGFVTWDESFIETQVSRRATGLRHVYPLRPEAVVELSVTGGDDLPASGTGVSASVAGRVVSVRWAGEASGRVGGVPFLREEEVNLTVRLSDAAKGAHPDWLSAIGWTGRLGTDPREVLRADVVLPVGEGPENNTLIGTGGSGSGAFRGRGLRRPVEDPGRVEVSVVGREGRPLANTRVGLGGTWSRTDARGIALFEDVSPGEQQVATSEPGVVTARGTVTVVGRRTSRITLHEPEGGTLDVEVVDESGVGLPFAAVTLLDSTWLDVADDGTQRTDPYTDHVGRRSLAHVRPGEVVVRAKFGRRTAQASAEVRDRERTVVRLVVK